MVKAGTWALFLLVAAGLAGADTLPLPQRPSGSPAGTELVRIIEYMPLDQREAWICNEVLKGNVPSWNREFVNLQFSQELAGSNYSVVLKVLPDYLTIGSDSDSFLCPLTPSAAQRIADKLGCALPTRKMVNLIWTNSVVKLKPQPIPPGESMITVPVFADHHAMVWRQRDQHTNAHPLGALVSGHKKDLVISSRIHTSVPARASRPVVIYGWHQPSGVPIQPLYNGHKDTWVDYSHGIRLVHGQAVINGVATPITDVLTNSALAALLNDETAAEGSTNGVISIPRYEPDQAQRQKTKND